MSDQYVANKDSAEVSYKKFELHPNHDQQYPTFSLCFLGSMGTQFFPLTLHQPLYDELYYHPSCQRPGAKNHTWCEISLYQSMMLGKEEITHHASNTSFVNVTVDALSNVTSWRLSSEGGDETKQTVNGPSWLPHPKKSMHLSYQDALRTCLTKTIEPGIGINHTYDSVSIPAEFFQTTYLTLEVYVHQVGRLISQIGRGHAITITHDKVNQMQHHSDESHSSISMFNEIRVKSVEILRKREDAETPCNKSIKNNDKKYKETIIKSVGCIPSFWKVFVDI